MLRTVIPKPLGDGGHGVFHRKAKPAGLGRWSAKVARTVASVAELSLKALGELGVVVTLIHLHIVLDSPKMVNRSVDAADEVAIESIGDGSHTDVSLGDGYVGAELLPFCRRSF